MTPQDSSQAPVQDFLAYLNNITRYCTATNDEAPTEYFIPRQDIDTYFRNTSSISSILKSLFPGQELPVRPDFIAEKCAVSFCILLRRGLGAYIQYFTKHHSLWDKNLPFPSRPTEFPQVPEDEGFWEKFRSDQWHFFPATLPRIHQVDFESDYILPFLTKEKLRVSTPANTAYLYKVSVHDQYDGMRYSDETSHGHRVYALKTYRGRYAAQYYHTEVQNFDKLCLRNRQAAPGLIRFYCGFTHRGTYNLLLEFANAGTLEDLFQTGDPPSSGDEILTFWNAFLECVQALDKIHELDLRLEDSEERDVFQGWHQDVKPSNILILCDDLERYSAYQFRLADLGLSHFLRMSSDEDPDALDAKGTRTYGAPEIHRRTAFDETRRIRTKRAVDVWSLGCVMLEICVWINRGRRYLNDFRSKRYDENKENESSAGDCFHNGCLPKPSILAVVRDERDRLLDDRRTSDFLTGRILDIIKRMLQTDEPRKRPSAFNVLADVENAIQEAEKDTKRHYETRSTAYGRSFSAPESPRTPPSSGLPHNNTFHTLHNPGSPGLSESVSTELWGGGRSGLPPRPRASIHQPAVIATSSGSNMKTADDSSKELVVPISDSNSTAVSQDLPQSPEPIVRSDTLRQRPSNDGQWLNLGHGRHSYAGMRPARSNAPDLSLEEALEWRKSSNRLMKAFGGNKLHKVEQFRSWFDNRDHIFLIDDSKSMEPYKDHIKMLLDPLAYIVKKGDPDGIDILYTVSPAQLTAKHSSDITQHLNWHRFDGKTDIGDRLHTILQKRQYELKTQSMARAASVYIFTDGVWEKGRDAKRPIREMINVLKQKKCARKQIGIQFISYGDDREGLARLDELDEFGKNPEIDFDIVDTERHNGNLLKMLLGAIDKTFDDVYVDHRG